MLHNIHPVFIPAKDRPGAAKIGAKTPAQKTLKVKAMSGHRVQQPDLYDSLLGGDAEHGLSGVYRAESDAFAETDDPDIEAFDICLPAKGSGQNGPSLKNVGKSAREKEAAT